MWALLPTLLLASTAQALHFFIDSSNPKCFFEDLPKDTLVVGNYAAEEWDPRTQAWQQHQGISIYISVDVRATTGRFLLSSPIHTHTHTSPHLKALEPES
jgi:hypothetical protein